MIRSLATMVVVAVALGACAAAPDEAAGQAGDPGAPSQSVDGLTVANCSESAIRAGAPPAAQPLLDRAFDWIHRAVPYCQCVTGAGGAYRTDCSGFVSMVWGLAAPGHTTYSFAGGVWDDHVARLISHDELQVGDALNFPGNVAAGTGHVVLFGGWLNNAHTQFCSLEESHTGTPARVIVRSVDPAYLPMRHVGYNPVWCTPHCDGTDAIDALCNRTHCGDAAAHCTAAGGPVRCASNYCPDTGSTDVCLPDTHLGRCANGALSDAGACDFGCRSTPGNAADACWVVPRGHVDHAGCDFVRGWAQDPNTPTAADPVDVYIDGPAGSGAPHVRTLADQRRDDLCTTLGSCDHGFALATPAQALDGRAHTLYVYGASTVGAPTVPALVASPVALHCPMAAAGDFNGDGRGDVFQYSSDWQSVPVCLSLASGWSCRNLATRDAAGDAIEADGAALFGDFAGDHTATLLEFGPRANSLPECRSYDTAWACDALAAGYAGGDYADAAAGNAGSGVYADARPLVGDFNGDGRDDVIQFRAAAQSLPVCASLGSGWSCRDLAAHYAGGDAGLATGNAGSGVYADAVPLVGDFNGDGRADLIQYNPGWQSIPVCVSLGSGWSCRNMAATWNGGGADTGPAGNAGSGVYADATPLVGDFNGDGRADLIQYNPAWTTIPVCLSLGTGWSCRSLPAYFIDGDYPDAAAGNAGSGVYPHATPVLADFNGDGRVDLAQFDSLSQSIPVCLSTGSGWSCRDLRATLVAGEAAGNAGSGVFPGGLPLVTDFNGDGRPDLVQYQSTGWSTLPVCSWLGSGWSCRNPAATYAGGLGPGNDGSGVY